MTSFDEFLAIDWSGAGGRYSGIAVARCSTRRDAPRIVPPPDQSRWTRTSLVDWLTRELRCGRRLLIGFDFGFGFPYEGRRVGYLGGQAQGVHRIFDLWDLVEARSKGALDFGCAPFVEDPRHQALFWTRGAQPIGWVDRKRYIERVCASFTGTRPDSLYKLLGSKQVGKASITGMRVLRQIRSLCGNAVAIWPFEEPKNSAVVEIYPTLFRKRATNTLAKIRSVPDLNSALARFDSRRFRGANAVLTDHEADAVISAAGLRAIAGDQHLWCPDAPASVLEREGWIFGVSGAQEDLPS